MSTTTVRPLVPLPLSDHTDAPDTPPAERAAWLARKVELMAAIAAMETATIAGARC